MPRYYVPVTCKTVAQSHVSWPHQKNKIWMRRAGPKFLPGAHPRSAPYPYIHLPLSLFPSVPPHHPHPEPWRETLTPPRARQHLLHILARTLLFPAHSEAKQIAHHGTGFPPRRPVPGAVTGFGSRLEHQPMGIKRGPWMAPRPLKNTM